jgi:hypothetical protein
MITIATPEGGSQLRWVSTSTAPKPAIAAMHQVHKAAQRADTADRILAMVGAALRRDGNQ